MTNSESQIYPTGDVTGIIIPNGWDEIGNIFEIAIYTNTEEIYRVENNQFAQALIKLMRKRVKVNGQIRKRPDGNRSIAVQNYSVLEENDDDEKKTN